MTALSKILACGEVREQLSDYLDGHLAAADCNLVNQHFVLCRECAQLRDQLAETVAALDELRIPEPTAEITSQVLDSLRRSNQLTAGNWSVEIKKTYWQLWIKLKPLSFTTRLTHLTEMTTADRRSFCEWLLEQTNDAVSNDPVEAVPVAEIAVLIADSLSEFEDTGDLCTRCYSALAVAHMAVSNLGRAREALRTAKKWQAGGQASLSNRARLLQVEAWLKSRTGCLEEAEDLLAEAEAIFTTLGDSSSIVRSQISRSSSLMMRNDYIGAVQLLREALPAIEETAPARVFWAARLNLAIAYCELGRVAEAQALVPMLRILARAMRGDQDIHITWLLGSIARAKGDWQKALTIFCHVRSVFRKRREAIHFVECSLDICRIYLMRSDWPRMMALVDETADVTRGISEEASILNAVTLLRASVREMSLTQAQVGAFCGLLWSRHSRSLPSQ